MLAPPNHVRRVDVPEDQVRACLSRGYILDPFPDTRGELHAALPGKHRGRTAIVFGSGPSMRLYPRSTIIGLSDKLNAVRWAVNDAWRVLDGRDCPADYLVILDDHYYRDRRDNVRAYLARYRNCLPAFAFDLNEPVAYLRLHINIGDTPDTSPPYSCNEYFHGNSSGITAIQMAMHAGCNPIYLLGHDCAPAPDGTTHGFGNRDKGKYPQGLTMLDGYKTIHEHASRLGVRVVNLSPIGLVRERVAFERASVEEVFNDNAEQR